jgi:hypothetical protein
MALNAQILLSILAHESDAGDISQTLRATPATYALALSDGTGAGQAQVVWSDSRTATTASDSINLNSLQDDRGTVAMTAVKALYMRNSGAATMNWNGGSWLTGPFSSPDDSIVSIPAGGAMLFVAPTAAGYPVTGSPNTIDVDAFSGSTTYDIILIGEGTIT